MGRRGKVLRKMVKVEYVEILRTRRMEDLREIAIRGWLFLCLFQMRTILRHKNCRKTVRVRGWD